MSETASPKPGPNPSKSRDAVLAVLQEVDSPPCLSAGDIEDRVEFSRRTVNNRLDDLREEGVIETGEVAGSPVYWVDNIESDGGATADWPNIVGASTVAFQLGARICLALALIFAVGAFWYNNLYQFSVLSVVLYLLFQWVVKEYSDVGDPASELKDLLRPFRAVKTQEEKATTDPDTTE